MKEAKQNSANPNIVLVLIGNKADLTTKRQVSSAEGKAYADKNEALFVELSARDQKKVEDIFMQSALHVRAVQRVNPLPKGSVVKLEPQRDQPSDSLDCMSGTTCG